jgi:glutathione synthase/RimK-type ligase-like ATP-grasp enzyme
MHSLAIMAGAADTDPPFHEQQYFRCLAQTGKRLGIRVYVFSPGSVRWRSRRIAGFEPDPSSASWRQRDFSLPDLIYDRYDYTDRGVLTRDLEHILKLRQTDGTRFLNGRLKGKWPVYRTLSKHPCFRRHLPATEPLVSMRAMFAWLEQKQEVFLKPEAGSQGKGAVHIQKDKSHYCVHGRSHMNGTVRLTFPNSDMLAAWLNRFIAGRTYLLQQFLPLKTAAGHCFDIRSLVQKNGSGRWEFAGTAVRLGQAGSVTANLHGGGVVLQTADFLKTEYGSQQAAKIQEQIVRLSQKIPPYLEQTCRQLIELGIDFGVDAHGRVWILEVNSSPGKSAFLQLQKETAFDGSVDGPIRFARYILDGNLGG